MTELVVGGTAQSAPNASRIERGHSAEPARTMAIGRMCDPGSSVYEESDAPVYSEETTGRSTKGADKLLRVLEGACQKIMGPTAKASDLVHTVQEFIVERPPKGSVNIDVIADQPNLRSKTWSVGWPSEARASVPCWMRHDARRPSTVWRRPASPMWPTWPATLRRWRSCGSSCAGRARRRCSSATDRAPRQAARHGCVSVHAFL